MTDRGGHSTDLAILAFDKFEREPAVWHGFAETNRWIARRDRGYWVQQSRDTRKRFEFAEIETSFHFAERGGRRDAFHLGPVFSTMSVLRIEQLRIEPGLVAQEQQAFRIGVESAQRVDVAREIKFGERSPT